jgi:hypothetical protein
VKGTGQAVETAGKRIIKVRQCGTNSVTHMGAHVPAFVVTVQGQIESHQIGQLAIRIGQAHHLGHVAAPVFLGIVGDQFAVVEPDPVDTGRKLGEPGDQVQDVLHGGFPILSLFGARCVGFGKFRQVLHRHDTHTDHGHGMGILGHGPEHIPYVAGNARSGCKIFLQALEFIGIGQFSCYQEPEDLLRKLIGYLKERDTADDETLFRADLRGIAYHALDTPHPAVGLGDRSFRKDNITVAFHKVPDVIPRSIESAPECFL